MTKNLGGMVKLEEYVRRYEVILHTLYEDFDASRIMRIPSVTQTVLTYCCRRRPIVIVPEGKKRIIIDNHHCYSHARTANNDIAIWIHEVKHVSEREAFLSTFLDSMQGCPILKMNPLYRVYILKKAYEKKESLIRDIFSVSSYDALCKAFGIAPSSLSRINELETDELKRLAVGKFKKRGKSNPREVKPSTQGNQLPKVATQKKVKKQIKLKKVDQEQLSFDDDV